MRSQANILEFTGVRHTSRRIRRPATKLDRTGNSVGSKLAVIITFSNAPELDRSFSLSTARVIDLNQGPEDAA